MARSLLAAAALSACQPSDPQWDLYGLQSYFLADLPVPRVVVAVVGAGEGRELTVKLDADLRCPIPLATAVHAALDGAPLDAVPGEIHGNGVGKSCWNPSFHAPLARLSGPPPVASLVLEDGTTRWEIRLVRPEAPRTLTLAAPTAIPGGSVSLEVGPPEDRWVADREGAVPAAIRLAAASADPAAACRTEFEQPLPAAPPDPLVLDVPPDFCPGDAFVSLSSSARRSAVAQCPAGVTCRYELGGFVAPVSIVAP